MEFDELPESYFAFVLSQGVPQPPPAARRLSLQRNASATRRLGFRKEVHGDLTALWIDGYLGERARFKRALAGLEGTVLVIAEGLAGHSEAGVEALRNELGRLPLTVYIGRAHASLATDVLAAGLPENVVLCSVVVSVICEACKLQRDLELRCDRTPVPRDEQVGACPSCGGASRIFPRDDALFERWARDERAVPSDVSEYLDLRRFGTGGPAQLDTAVDRRSRYQYLERIGTGGMAEIYLARLLGPASFERLVVLKRMLPHLADRADFVEMFISEARLAAAIHHPNVVQIYELGQLDGGYFIAMEYVDGWDLREILSVLRCRNATVPVPVACRLVAEVCAGLHAAHSCVGPDNAFAGLVHRDVSPKNILVSRAGGVKLADFGIAKALQLVSEQTDPGILKGKLDYMAPEQLDPRLGEVSAATDIYAAAILLLECVSKQPPRMSVSLRGRDFAAELRPEVGTRLSMLIDHALERDPSRRLNDAQQFREWLLELVNEIDPNTRLERWIGTLALEAGHGREAEEHEVTVFDVPEHTRGHRLGPTGNQ